MGFLAPLFFVALGALAVPIVVHLIQRERKTTVPFPSLMFLRRIPYQSVRRRRIRHWSLLALRLLALALIVAAFARPFLRGTGAAAMTGGARDVVVLLDRSYSMGYGDTWARAQAAARQAIESLEPADRASLVLFSGDAEVAARTSADRGQVLSAIDAAAPLPAATRYGAALKLAGSLLAESSLPRREVVLVSDFQRAGWEPSQVLRLPGGATLTPVSVRAADVNDVAVTPVSLQRETFSGRERVTVSSGVINRGAAAAGVTATLEIDGKPIETLQVNVGPHAAQSFAFPPVTLDEHDTRGAVRISDDPLAFDNVQYFVLSPAEPIHVARLAARTGPEDGLFLTRALSIGDRPHIDLASRAGDDLPADALARARVAIVDDAAVSGAGAARLARFVRDGGGLLFVAGPRASWPERELDVLPASIGPMVDRTRGTPASMSALEYGHAVFEPFRAPRSGDFSSARVYAYRASKPAADAQVLARFDDGAPALIERRVGLGRVLLWTSTFDLEWTDLPLEPVFLPLVHRMVRYLAEYRERPASLTVGHLLEIGPGTSDKERVVLAPGGERHPVPGRDASVIALDQQGFYEVHDPSAGTGPVEVVASNVDLAESDFTPVDPQEIVAAVGGGGAATAAGQPGQTPPDEWQERTQRLWWYLLFAGILLLTAETWLAERLSRAA